MTPSTRDISEPVERASLESVLLPVKAELDAVDARLLAELTEPEASPVAYIVRAGGKRLRPALVLLSSLLGQTSRREALIEAATAMELIHTATLVHDDIVDESPVRRQQPAFHQRWGTARAVLTGDYLYTTAMNLLARLRDPVVTEVVAKACHLLSRGELREVEVRYRLDLSEAEYLTIIRDKTSSLMEGCCRIGAVLGGAPTQAIERIAEFGRDFGVAFQITDDCLDLMGDPRQLGKSVLTDLEKGVVSLPIIYLIQRLTPAERDRLFAPLLERERDPAFLGEIAKEAAGRGAIAQAQARAREYVGMAEAALAGLSIDGLDVACRQLAWYAIARGH